MTSTAFARILSELSDPTALTEDVRHSHNVFQLATLADCYSPDSDDSPGAAFLARVARDVADRVNEEAGTDVIRDLVSDLTEDGAHEIADSAVPIYTHERWQAFVDLGAYNEDTREFGAMDDLTDAAGIALYLIAERLVRALAEELTEALDEDDDSDDDGYWIVAGLDGEQLAGPFATEQEADNEDEPHVGHFSRLGGTWWCDTCNSPYCELA